MTHSGICRGDALLIDKYYRVICALKSTKNKSFWKEAFGQPRCSAELRPNLRFPLPVLCFLWPLSLGFWVLYSTDSESDSKVEVPKPNETFYKF